MSKDREARVTNAQPGLWFVFWETTGERIGSIRRMKDGEHALRGDARPTYWQIEDLSGAVVGWYYGFDYARNEVTEDPWRLLRSNRRNRGEG